MPSVSRKVYRRLAAEQSSGACRGVTVPRIVRYRGEDWAVVDESAVRIELREPLAGEYRSVIKAREDI